MPAAEPENRTPPMGKRLSEIVLLLTGTLLLVLSAVPHHHHGERICFGSEERCPDCRSECTGSHRHDEPQAGCDLRHLFVMSGRDDDSLRPATDSDDDPFHRLLSAAMPCEAIPTKSFVSPETGRSVYRSLRRQPESSFEGAALSLRAPPCLFV